MRALFLAAAVAFVLWLLTRSRSASASLFNQAATGGGGSDGDLLSTIRNQAIANGVDPALALSVAQAESNFKQSALSPVGAIGIFQLMPNTAAGLGVDPYETQGNIIGGTRYLSQMLDRYNGDYVRSLAAYNWGPSRVDRAIATYGDNWAYHIPAETSSYIDSVFAGDAWAA